MDSYDLVKNILSHYKKMTFDFDIYVIADIQDRTCKIGTENIIHADESEFFSRTEFAEIASAIFYCFGFVRVFYSELEFIKYILGKNINYGECIVYNFARDGRANGKKSLIPAFCDLLNIKYTGSNAFVISLLRNKYIYTEFLAKNQLSVPNSRIYTTTNDFSKLLNTFINQQVIVKNRYDSASIGLTNKNVFYFNADSAAKLSELLISMKTDSLLIQEYIDGIECEVLVLQYKGCYYALEPIKINFKTKSNFIDVDTSNHYNYSFEVLTLPLSSTIKKTAEKAAALLGIKDYARFDFRIKDNIPYLFDIAGTPYTIYHSSIAYLFMEYYQLPYETIYKTIITCMLSNYELNQK